MPLLGATQGAMPESEVELEAEACLEEGVVHYAAGDLRPAAAKWIEALALLPGDERLRGYVDWAVSRLRIEDPEGVPPEFVDPAAPGAAALGLDAKDSTQDPAFDRTGPQDSGLGASGSAAPTTSASAVHHVPLRSGFRGVEAPVRRFLSRTPTKPNLPPLDDIHVLTDEGLRALARALSPGAEDLEASAEANDSDEQSSVPALIIADDPEDEVPFEHAGSSFVGEPDGSFVGLGGQSFAEPNSRLIAPLRRLAGLPVSVIPDSSHHREPPAPSHSTHAPHAAQAASRAGAEPAPLPPPVHDEVFDAARRIFARGDLEGAYAAVERAGVAEGALASSVVGAHAGWLRTVYERRLGDRTRLVRLGTTHAGLDARAAYLVSRVDGTFTVEDLLDVSGMDRIEAARLVARLLDRGVLDAS